jgi:hypothetical protein
VQNGQGLCEACDYAKTAPGWAARGTSRSGVHTVTTTPTGHTYRSRPPEPPGYRRLAHSPPRIDVSFVRHPFEIDLPAA